MKAMRFGLWVLSLGMISGSAWGLKIISLSPHLTELVYTAGAGNQLVAVDQYSNYPPQAQSLPVVADALHLNWEALSTLQADTLLLWHHSTHLKQRQRLMDLGLNVVIFDEQQLNDIPRSIERIGQLAQTQTHATKQAARLRHLIDTSNAVAPVNRHALRVFYQVWHPPFYTVNRKDIFNQVIEHCGGVNVFSHLPMPAPQVSLEAIVMAQPQVLVFGGTPQQQAQWHHYWQNVPQLPAAQAQHWIDLPADIFQRPTARLIEAMPSFCQQLQQITEPTIQR